MLLNTSEVHEDVEREFTKNSSLFHIFRDPLRHMPTDFISEWGQLSPNHYVSC